MGVKFGLLLMEERRLRAPENRVLRASEGEGKRGVEKTT